MADGTRSSSEMSDPAIERPITRVDMHVVFIVTRGQHAADLPETPSEPAGVVRLMGLPCSDRHGGRRYVDVAARDVLDDVVRGGTTSGTNNWRIYVGNGAFTWTVRGRDGQERTFSSPETLAMLILELIEEPNNWFRAEDGYMMKAVWAAEEA
ncbi:hypothetical protein Micbo1qcDRAFT_223704 [Microdochium bolleyi]|uniref:Uncharacterized protein n=1 Tax=Microdochium bolleyi TaxID=196109 RepID=A0A136IJL9_9PEZI|nr:hypothetical protein Micbo1qcDRAFT_223704 [Microdochium bolleyi]